MSRQKTPYSRYRPKGMPERVWRKIIEAWENGLSDREAAFRASEDGKGISELELREIVLENPDIADLKDQLHSKITSQAKINILNDIENGNVATSKWYLERKAAQEFSTKAAIAFDDAVVELSINDKQAQMREFMEQFDVEDEPIIVEGIEEKGGKDGK